MDDDNPGIPELLTTAQVAKLLQMSEAWVRLAVAAGDLPVVRLGRRTLFDAEDVRALIARNRVS